MYPLNNENLDHDRQLQRTGDHQKGGKINDDLRYLIIEQVAQRPAIWDHGRAPKCLGRRKDHFIEIAALLSTDDNVLSCYDVEKQWKNLKDTYIKTRKKLVIDEGGCIVPPRWKFFSAMMFLDQLGTDAANSSNTNQLPLHVKRSSRSKRLQIRKQLAPELPSDSGDNFPKSVLLNKNTSTNFSTTYADDEYTAFC
uniref:MADF domain-containing protein n=1 Tax=Syphacia muris TaxID=451379 RepID=A0A0N5ARP1_9BILA